MRRYLSNPTKGLRVTQSDEGGGGGGGGGAVTARISRIFLWFEADFLRSGGNLQGYVLRYVDEPTAAKLTQSGTVRWAYFVYNWDINRPG